MKIAVLDDYQNVARDMADWSGLQARHQITFFHDIYEGPEGFAKRLAPYEVVCLMRERSPFRADLIAKLPNLKLVVTAGMRNAAIDLDACKARGIPVVGTQNSAQATPELVWGMMLAMARNIHIEDQRMRQGNWITTLGTDLQGKTLGILGLGRLGRKMAQIGRVFDMEVIAWSHNLTADSAAEAGATRVGKEALFRQSDFLTIHYKLGERSRLLVGAAELALMKPTAYLVNASRGPIVDTKALIETLTAGRIAGAGIDVYDSEPLAPDHPIRNCPRTLLTPHLGYVTDGVYRSFYSQMVEDIAAWEKGAPIRVLA